MRLTSLFLVTICACLFSLKSTAFAVAPTEEAIRQFKAEGRWDEIVARLQAFREAGGCQPVSNTMFTNGRFAEAVAANPAAVETLYVPVILVDFPDFKYNQTSYAKPGGGSQSSPAIATLSMIDSILFSEKGHPISNPTGSMTDYFLENSYGKVFIAGDVYGWYTVDNNYSFYVGTDDGLVNGPTLANDAVIKAMNAGINWVKYDNDNDNFIDGVVVIHAGPGAETGAYGVWSHRWNTPAPVSLPGGKFAYAYTLNPEEYFSAPSPIGVFCHEYGHVLGLPDLYDTNPTHTSSEGLGSWSLMATGNYNGNSQSPAHFDPWCKHQLGFLNMYDHQVKPTTPNLHQAPIPQAESEPFAYYLAADSAVAEYFLIENRQRTGFDIGLPGEGLCIYHVDETQGNNNNPARYKVALMQADGFNQLATGGSRGDNADPFPGASNNRNWYDLSTPNSRLYSGVATQFAAWNISNSDSLMYADLDSRWSRPWVLLSGPDSIQFTDNAPDGNGNGVPEAGETVSFSFGLRNLMRTIYQARATLTCLDPSISILNNGVALADSVSTTNPSPTGPATPIKLTIPADWETKNVGFTLKLDMDSTLAGGDSTWHTTFAFASALGRIQILLVDDDNGKTYENRYKTVLDSLGLPYAVWTKKTQLNPPASELAPYKNVFWFLGNEFGGGVIDNLDIASLKAHMNSGKNVFLAGIVAAPQIWSTDSAFLIDYFHARPGGTTPDDVAVSVYDGVPGNGLSDHLTLGIFTAPVSYINTILTPQNGGVPTFTFKDEFGGGNFGNGGVIFSGTHRSVLLSFAPEMMSTATIPVTLQPLDSLVQRVLNFFATGAVASVDDPADGSLPNGFVLLQNYPNPFNPTTTISYTIPYSSPIRPVRTTLKVYNVMGQEVATLVDRIEGPGNFSASWDGRNYNQQAVSSGPYFYRLIHGELTTTKKMVLLK